MDPIARLLGLERLGMKFGLETITRLCAELGDPHRAFASVIVAGTNGKGSVTAMVERGLRAAGHRSARYTSPHLSRLEERYLIDGREVATAALRAAAAEVLAAADRLEQRGALAAPATFFECATAAAFLLFRDAGVAVAVLEVGLGGRLDATNVVTPLVAAITSIDFDHQAQLGTTLAAIAAEKAGVIKPGIPVVCGPVPAEALAVIERACAAAGARLVAVAPDGPPASLAGAEPVLRGRHQRINAAVAAQVLEELDRLGTRVDREAVRTALTDVVWPARLEELAWGETRVLLDAAHNPAGARALAAYLRETGWDAGALLFGAMQDKDAGAMLAALKPACRALVCTTAPTPRALAAAALAALAAPLPPAVPVEAVADPAAALARARALAPRVVVAGSIFLLGPVRDTLLTR